MRLYAMELAVDPDEGVPVPGYLIQTDDGTNVLVDTGLREPGEIGFQMEEDVVGQLARIGLSPGDVHYLVCTHFDPDHSGHHDAFPEAELVVQRVHYEVAKKDESGRFSASRPYWDRPELSYRLIEGDAELAPGVELVESGGHAPGHQSVLVRLPETGPVLLAIDAVPTTAHTDPEEREISSIDTDAEQVRRSTRKLIELAEREDVSLIIHGHDPEQWPNLEKLPESYE